MKLFLAKLIGFYINMIAYISPSYAACLAISLFSKPRKGKHTNEAINFLDTALQEEINFKDFSIMTYRWLGNKETILLVHGWESNAFRWKNLIETLKPQCFNVVAIDAPAHGKSGGASFNVIDYSECIHLVAKKFNAQTIIGHSIGGMAAIICQYQHKLPTLKRIALLGAPSNYKDIFKRYINMMGYHKLLTKSIDEFVLKLFGHLPRYYNAARFSKDLTLKGLIIHDIEDTIIPYQDALDYKANFANSKFITTNNLDHSLKANDVNNHILEFISN